MLCDEKITREGSAGDPWLSEESRASSAGVRQDESDACVEGVMAQVDSVEACSLVLASPPTTSRCEEDGSHGAYSSFPTSTRTSTGATRTTVCKRLLGLGRKARMPAATRVQSIALSTTLSGALYDVQSKSNTPDNRGRGSIATRH